MSRLIDADAFDERVRVAGGMSEDELTDDFKDGVQTVLYMLSNQPTIQPEPHWIPVTERLPDVGIDGEIEILGYAQLAIADSTFKISNPVLATRKIDDRYELAVLQWEVDGNDGKYWVNDGGDIIKGVIAWMPLPEPYKEVTE